MFDEGLLNIDCVVFVFERDRPNASEILTFSTNEEAISYCIATATARGYDDISAPLCLPLALESPVVLSFQPSQELQQIG